MATAEMSPDDGRCPQDADCCPQGADRCQQDADRYPQGADRCPQPVDQRTRSVDRRSQLVDRLHAEKPHMVVYLGYALFLAVNATAVWGGVFPFLPFEFQTPDIISGFFLAQSGVFAFTFLIAVLVTYRHPKSTLSFHVWPSIVPYLIGWCLLIAAIYLPAVSLPLCYGSGAALGLGTAEFFMLWQKIFCAHKGGAGRRDLVLGTLIAPLIYFGLHLIPIAVTTFLIPLIFTPLFGLTITLASRDVDLTQPMFRDVPREHPMAYRHVIKDYWRSALCFGSLAFACGAVRAFALKTPQVGLMVNMISMIALLISAGILLFVWQLKALRFNIAQIFRVFFPLVMTAFFLLPVLNDPYLTILAGMLYAFYGCSITLIMIQCAQASRDRSINPIFIYGFMAGAVYVLHDLGYIIGTFGSGITVFGMDAYTSFALVSLYAMSLIFYFSQGGMKAMLSPSHAQAEKIELVATAALPSRNRPSAGAPEGTSYRSRVGDAAYFDRLSKQCVLMQRHFKLSDRESQIIELIARGNTSTGIAQSLGVSENTVRTHTKRIYAKLDIHKKQDLLDLVGSFDPKALTDNDQQ